MASIDLGRGKSPEQIKALILAAYVERGWEPPADFERLSRIISARTAHRARGLRVAVELGKTVRWAMVALRSDDAREKNQRG